MNKVLSHLGKQKSKLLSLRSKKEMIKGPCFPKNDKKNQLLNPKSSTYKSFISLDS